jgi:hypothetical protein
MENAGTQNRLNNFLSSIMLEWIVSADAASEQQTLLKATQAMFDLQQLQARQWA